MKIIVVGIGRTGSNIISALASEEYDVTVIDKDPMLVNSITDKYNVGGVVGSGASRDTLLLAGADTADVIIAVTHVDEINLISCMQAKALGTKKAAARILEPDLVYESENLKKEYKIDYFVKPNLDMAEEIYRNIGLPGFVKLEGYWGDNLEVVDINILDGSPLKDRTLMDIKKNSNLDLIVGTVTRDGKLHIPDGNFTLRSGDNVSIVATGKDMKENLRSLGIINHIPKNIIIVGGCITLEYLVPMLEKNGSKVTVIESDRSRCDYLIKRFSKLNVIYANGDIMDELEKDYVKKSDALVSITNSDEINLVISMYGFSIGIPSVLTRVNKPEHVKLLHKVNIDITVSPTLSSSVKMLRFVRNSEIKEGNMGKFYNIAQGEAEIMDFHVDSNFCMANIPLMDESFKMRKDVLIAAICRNGETIIPSGTSSILYGDNVIIVASKDSKIRSLEDIFNKSIHFKQIF